MKSFLKTCLFLTLGFVLLLAAQTTLIPKFRYPRFDEAPEDMLEEFYSLPDKNTVQALFLGSSMSEFHIDPMRIYAQTGIVTFNLGTGNQRMQTSYYLLKEALTHAQPKAIFLEVGSMYRWDDWNPQTRYILDNMRVDQSKVEFSHYYSQRFPKEKRIGAFLSGLFPIYEYHGRWNELDKNDITVNDTRNLYRKGYFLQASVYPSINTLEWINEIADHNHRADGWIREVSDGTDITTQTKDILYDPQISEENLKLLRSIQQLCAEKNVELVLFKAPSVTLPVHGPSAWTLLKSQQITQLAGELGLQYFDFIYQRDPGIDWSVDTADGGYHMNVLGADKFSSDLAELCKNELRLSTAVNRAYEEDMPIYRNVHEAAMVETEQYLPCYLRRLRERRQTTVFLAAYDDMAMNLSTEERQALAEFGLKTNLPALVYSDSYLAILSDGESLYESCGNRRIEKAGRLKDGTEYSVSSCGFRAGSEANIIINGRNYSMQRRGINIVVFDNASGYVLDSVCFDTWAEGEHIAIRDNSNTEKFLREYEQYLMRQDYERGIR